MPLLDLQRRLREIGRIRTGRQVPTSKGGTRPAKLETFRLTSPSREAIEAAAVLYGGECSEWKGAPGDAQQWEVFTKASTIEAIVPPASTMSQFWEMWSGGGCQRRCDGETELLGDRECLCPADPAERRKLAQEGKACKPTTRLSLILPQLPDIGVWRLESHGFYAAVELAGAQQICSLATARGQMIPVRLRLDPREIRRPGQPTMKFAVPVLEISATLGQVFEALGVGSGPLILEPGAAFRELPAPAASDRLTQLGDGQPGARVGPSLEQGLARVAEGERLRTPEPKGKQRRTAAMPGPAPAVGDDAFRDSGPPDIDAGAPAPPPPPGGELPKIPMASKAQIKALQTIASKLGWTDEERHELAGAKHFEDLTKDRAGELIEDWGAQLAARQAGPSEPLPRPEGTPPAEMAGTDVGDLAVSGAAPYLGEPERPVQAPAGGGNREAQLERAITLYGSKPKLLFAFKDMYAPDSTVGLDDITTDQLEVLIKAKAGG